MVCGYSLVPQFLHNKWGGGGLVVLIYIARGTMLDCFSGNFLRNSEIIFFCFVVAISDLVHKALVNC